MAIKSGAGAAVASGAGYQARVAAYFVACSLTGLPIPFIRHGLPSRMSMETGEAVDDLQITFDKGRQVFVQAKRSITFSVDPGSELHSVLSQFASQQSRTIDDDEHEYCLITTSRSSKRITGDMLAVLEAARNCSRADFLRDQPKSLVGTYDLLVASIAAIQRQMDERSTDDDAYRLLSKSRVIVLDIDPHSSLEQAIVIALHSKGYAAPSEMWGKLVSDCLEWARRRQTVILTNVMRDYEHLRVIASEARQINEHQYFKVKLSGEGFEVGRELIIGKALSDLRFIKKNTVGVIEFYRFDENCQPRLQFEGDRLILEPVRE